MKRPLPIATLVALAACGAPAAPGSNQNSCTITISGAETAKETQDCTPAAAVNSAGEAAFTVSMTAPSFGELQFSGEFSGPSFRTGTYDQTSFIGGGTTLQSSAGTAFWAELMSPDAGTGAAKLVISSTGSQLTTNGATAWFGGHGTLDATLPPVEGTSSTGTATVHMSF